MHRCVTGKTLWIRAGALSLAAVVGLVLGYEIATAETEYYGDYVNGVWHAEEAYTSMYNVDSSGIYYTLAYTFPYFYYNGTYYEDNADFLYLESRGYNDSGGWHLIDDEWNTKIPGECVYNCVETGPVDAESWQCDHAGCCCPNMYTTAYHYEALYSNGPYFLGFTSSDGYHSSERCYDYAGC